MDMENAYGWLLLYGNALVLVGFHIDFALVLAVAPVQKKENNLIKNKSYGIFQ
jgi:hypothetical protein